MDAAAAAARAERAPAPKPHLDWLDGVKALSILWIAFFHYFEVYARGRYPSPLDAGYFARFVERCAPRSAIESAGCIAGAGLVAASRVGFHAVGVFLLMSGFGLAYSLAATAGPENGWGAWYRSRVVRLFPMYWIAHLVYLISPFVARPEPIDYRFVLSFFGDRVWPIDVIFYYFNPALWYFGLLLELYLAFPILYLMLRRLGPAAFLAAAAAVTFGSRAMLLMVTPVDGKWVQGGFFACRLGEFALGMVVGDACRKHPARVQAVLFAPAMLVAGIGVYALGLYSYASLGAYVFTDALVASGLFVILAALARGAAAVPGIAPALGGVGAFSYGLYLLHQPYVIWVGERARGLSVAAFVAVGFGLVGILAAASVELERRVNRAVAAIVG